MFPFFGLPTELQVKILSYQDYKSVSRCRKTCRKMNELIVSHNLNKLKLDLLRWDDVKIEGHIFKDSKYLTNNKIDYWDRDTHKLCYTKVISCNRYEVLPNSLEELKTKVRSTESDNWLETDSKVMMVRHVANIVVSKIEISPSFCVQFGKMNNLTCTAKCLTLIGCKLNLEIDDFVNLVTSCDSTTMNCCSAETSLFEQIDEKVLLNILHKTNFCLHRRPLFSKVNKRVFLSNEILQFFIEEENSKFEIRKSSIAQYERTFTWNDVKLFIQAMFKKERPCEFHLGRMHFTQEDLLYFEKQLKSEFPGFELESIPGDRWNFKLKSMEIVVQKKLNKL